LSRPEGIAFMKYFVESSAKIADEALFVPMTSQQQQASSTTVESLAKG
jgi:hypothetical protein